MSNVLTIILIMITGVYVFVTYRILKANQGVVSEMRKQRDSMSRPYIRISPFFLPGSQTIYLMVTNSGLSAAENLRLILDRDFYMFGHKSDNSNLRLCHAFQEPIECFVPKTELLFILASGPQILDSTAKRELTPSIFEVTANYEYQDRKVKEKTTIDLRPYSEAVVPSDPMAVRLKELEKQLKRIADQMK